MLAGTCYGLQACPACLLVKFFFPLFLPRLFPFNCLHPVPVSCPAHSLMPAKTPSCFCLLLLPAQPCFPVFKIKCHERDRNATMPKMPVCTAHRVPCSPCYTCTHKHRDGRKALCEVCVVHMQKHADGGRGRRHKRRRRGERERRMEQIERREEVCERHDNGIWEGEG